MGYVYSFDISIPLDRFYEIVELTREKLKDVTDCKAVSGFGHIGEFKINYNPIQVNNLYKQKVLVCFYFKNLKRLTPIWDRGIASKLNLSLFRWHYIVSAAYIFILSSYCRHGFL